MTILKDYLSYTKKYSETYGERTLVLMQIGSFFECYALIEKDGSYSGSHICEFAEINDMTISKMNVCVDNKPGVMAGFGLPQLEKYIKKMQEHGYTVVVFTQDNPSKNTTRSLSAIYSPGTFFSNDTSSSSLGDNTSGLSNNTTCIWIHYSAKNNSVKEMLTIGISNIDIFTGKTSINEICCEYYHNPTTYDELEKFISIYKPSETIIISNLGREIIDSIIQFTGITSRQIHIIELDNDCSKNTELQTAAINSERQIYQQEIFNKFYKSGSSGDEPSFITTYYEYCIAVQSFCFLLEFIYQHNPNLVSKIEKPIIENLGNRLILANHSLKQLNIISDNRYSGKLGSVSALLNNAITTMGKRSFNYNLLNPITDIDMLNRSYSITDHFIRENTWEYIRQQLTNIKDFEKIKRKLIMKRITPRDFYNLCINLSTLQDLYRKFKEDKTFQEHIQRYLNMDFLESTEMICQFIKRNFSIEQSRLVDDLSTDKLNKYSLENVQFINRDVSAELDRKTKACVDSREVFEAIRAWLSKQVEEYESSSKKASSSNEYIKIHDTPKSDAMLIGTKRRVNILKTIIEKRILKECEKECEITLEYTSKYSNTVETYKFMISDLVYRPHGGNQTNLIVVSPQINKLASYIQSSRDVLTSEIQSTYYQICQDFIREIERSDTCNLLDDAIAFTRECDLIQCRCYIATKYNYCRPEIDEKATKSYVDFQQIRHPLIEQLNHRELYVTNDFCIGRGFEGDTSPLPPYLPGDTSPSNISPSNISPYNISPNKEGGKGDVSPSNKEGGKGDVSPSNKEGGKGDVSPSNVSPSNVSPSNGMLLYGTNAVGKTSFIKSIGIATIMAQAGLYVPCSSFRYLPYNYIFTRILGNDNIFKGLSTFAVEMSELRTILKQSNQNSLILGDELCSGTESTSALSIFAAGLERLHEIGASFIFATHFHEILEYREIRALNKMKVYHMSVIFDRERNTLVYDRKLQAGGGEAMYGLEVCKSLDLPDQFLDRAYQIRNKYCNKQEITSKTTSKDSIIGILSAKKSKYNAKKLRGGMCELCNENPASEIHHLQYQKNADQSGIIGKQFHKNHKANLVNLCELCHDKIHESGKEHRITKTTDGYQISELS